MKGEEVSLASYIILSYNQEGFIEEAVKSAFAQTYRNLEIIISDDNSTDNTYKVITELVDRYTGPHRVMVSKNGENLGLTQHVNKAVSSSNGDVVILAAGDDVSLPERAKEICDLFNQNPTAMSISHSYKIIDNNGRFISNTPTVFQERIYNLSDYIVGNRIPIFGATRAYRKCVFERYPGLLSSCQAEDAALVFRALMIGDIYHSSLKLIKYRAHAGSISRGFNFESAKSICRQNLKDLKYMHKYLDISPIEYISIKNTIMQRLRVGIIHKKMSINYLSLGYYFTLVLFSGLFSVNEKKNIAKQIIKNHVLIIKGQK